MNSVKSNYRTNICRVCIRYGKWFIATLLLTLYLAMPAAALPQLPSSSGLSPVLSQLGGVTGASANKTAIGSISLDGRNVFQIAAPSATLTIRQNNIERNLKEIRDAYLEMSAETQTVNISTKTSENGSATSLYVSSRYLM
ncbi:MAG: hypothetical protein WBD47_03640, partial [Phormidesmis sp.]